MHRSVTIGSHFLLFLRPFSSSNPPKSLPMLLRLAASPIAYPSTSPVGTVTTKCSRRSVCTWTVVSTSLRSSPPSSPIASLIIGRRMLFGWSMSSVMKLASWAARSASRRSMLAFSVSTGSLLSLMSVPPGVVGEHTPRRGIVAALTSRRGRIDVSDSEISPGGRGRRRARGWWSAAATRRRCVRRCRGTDDRSRPGRGRG